MTGPSPDVNPALHGAALPARVRIPPHVVYRRFETETVVLNLQTGRYHGLNRTASHMLESLEQQSDTTATLQHLATLLPVSDYQLKHDLATLCHELVTRGLIEIDDQQDG